MASNFGSWIPPVTVNYEIKEKKNFFLQYIQPRNPLNLTRATSLN